MTEQPQPTDEDLVRAAQAGSTPPFERLVERYFGLVYSIAFAQLQHRETAEDLAQEVFLRAHLHLAKLGEPRWFSAWLTRIARNLAYDWQKRGQRASRLVAMVPVDVLEETVPDPESEGAREKMEAREQSESIQTAIFSLPLAQREIVLLHFSEGLGATEISARLGVHPTTVRRQIKHAVKAMRQSLEPILRDAAPRLRPPRAAVARAIVLVGAASVLSVATRSSIASAATGTLEAAALSETSAATVGTGTGFIALLKTIPAILATGGKVMGAGKIAAVVVSLAVVGGGVAAYRASSTTANGHNATSEVKSMSIAKGITTTPNLPVDKVTIRPAEGKERDENSFTEDSFTGKGLDLYQLISLACDLSPARVVMPLDLTMRRYDVNLVLSPSERALLRPTIRRALEEKLGLAMRLETKKTGVYVLTAPDSPHGLRPSMSPQTDMKCDPDKMMGRGAEMNLVVLGLEVGSRRPVIDETNLKGKYDYDMSCNMQDPAALSKGVSEQLGLRITPATRPVEMLIVEKR